MIETSVNRFPEEFSEYQAARRSHWDYVATAQMRSWGSYYRKRLIDVYRLHVPEGSVANRFLYCGCSAAGLARRLSCGSRGTLEHWSGLASLCASIDLGYDFRGLSHTLGARLRGDIPTGGCSGLSHL